MKNSFLKNQHLVSIAATAFMAVSCGKDTKTAEVSVDVSPKSMQQVDRLQESIQSTTIPTEISGYDCLALNVSGVDGVTTVKGIGLVSDLVPLVSGGTAKVNIPFGSGIVFQMFAVKSEVGCTKGATQALLQSETDYPIVTEVGRVTANITGDTRLVIESKYDSTRVVDVRTGKTPTTTTPSGGSSGGGTSSPAPIGSAPVRPTGFLHTFSQLTPTMPVAHEHAAAIEIGSKIYLIGGSLGTAYDGLSSGTTTGILESTIDGSGFPGAFTKSAYALSVPRKGARAEKIGNYVYVFGGYSGSGQTTSTPLRSIERATFDENGLTSSFTVIPEQLARGRYNFLTLVTPGYVYALGGGISTSYNSDTIERAPLDTTTGEIGDFVAQTRTVVDSDTVTDGLVDARWTHNGIRLGDNFYILGGESLDTIEKVTINSDGTIGSFVRQTGRLNSTRNRLSIVALNGRAYVFGGWSGTFLTSVESAPITNNELGAFTVSCGVTLASGVENGTSLLTTQGAYLFGGSSGSVRNYIQRAPIETATPGCGP